MRKEVPTYVDDAGDVPSVLRFDGKKWPLGRYLKEELRKEAGMLRERAVRSVVIRSGSRFTPGYVAELVRLQEELRFVVDRESRESRRLQHSANAESRVRVNQSKKGTL